MQWSVHLGDLLDVPADVLVCSGNVYLNLSGGVGGAFLLRYGAEMQEYLHRHLKDLGLRHVPRGTIVSVPPCGAPYRTVIHAVGVDGAYETSVEILREIVGRCLAEAARQGAGTVALTAIGTGYGRMSAADFGRAIAPLVAADVPPIERVIVGLRSATDVEELCEQTPSLERTTGN